MWGVITGSVLGGLIFIGIFISLIDEWWPAEGKFVEKLATIGMSLGAATLGGGIPVGIFVSSASFTKAEQNAVTIWKNQSTGNLEFSTSAGIKFKNPMLSKVGFMYLTQQEVQFGNEDPNKGIGGYLPFNDSKNNEFNASVNVKYSIQDRGAMAIEDARALYSQTGGIDVHAGVIISTIRQEAIRSMQKFVLTQGENGGAVETLQILSKKAQMSAQIKTDIQAALDAKYKVNDRGYLKIDTATIGDIVAPEQISNAIAEAAKRNIESLNKKAVAENEKQAAIAELETRKQQQHVKEQEALNELLGNPMIIAALVSAGVDTSSIDSISQLSTALNGKDIKLNEIIKTSKYFETWNGQLPQVVGQNSDVMVQLPTGA